MRRARRQTIARGNLTPRARRRIARLVARVRAASVFVDGAPSFRDAERAHRAGLIVAVVSKANIWGSPRRPFRELELFATRDAALARYDRVLPGARR